MTSQNWDPIEFLMNRRSLVVRDMTEPGPSDAELDQIINAGLRVPDHGRCAPWRIQIVRKEAQGRLGEVFAQAYLKEHPDATDEELEVERDRPQRAPVLLVVTAYPNMERIAKVPVMEQKLSGGALCQNILNGAHALGYAAQWLTEWPVYNSDIKRALGHAADTEIIALIYIGSAPEKPGERARAEYAQVVTEWKSPEDNPVAAGIPPRK